VSEKIYIEAKMPLFYYVGVKQNLIIF